MQLPFFCTLWHCMFEVPGCVPPRCLAIPNHLALGQVILERALWPGCLGTMCSATENMCPQTGTLL